MIMADISAFKDDYRGTGRADCKGARCKRRRKGSGIHGWPENAAYGKHWRRVQGYHVLCGKRSEPWGRRLRDLLRSLRYWGAGESAQGEIKIVLEHFVPFWGGKSKNGVLWYSQGNFSGSCTRRRRASRESGCGWAIPTPANFRRLFSRWWTTHRRPIGNWSHFINKLSWQKNNIPVWF